MVLEPLRCFGSLRGFFEPKANCSTYWREDLVGDPRWEDVTPFRSHMRRYALVILGIAVIAWAVAALVSHSPSVGLVSASSNAAPACLPTSLAHTAALPGTGLDVSPEPGTDTANPRTQVSFLGVPAARIHDVAVAGARSGPHAGRLLAYSQGDGASFVPDAPFAPGERVTVHATIAPGGGAAGRPVAFAFRVSVPYSTAHVPEFPAPPAAPSDSQSFETLPGVRVPVLSVTTPDRDPATGDVFTTNGPGPGQYGPLIYTPQGRLVWFEPLSGGVTAENLSVQVYEGQPHLTWWRGRVLSLGFGQGEDLVMDSHYRTVLRLPGGNGLPADLHDFQLAPHEVAYITVYNPIRCDLVAAGGARDGAIVDAAVQELDVRTGLVRWEWHSLDHVGADESQTSPPKGVPWDWFHLNSVDVQPDGNLFVAARSTWAGYLLQGGTGRILWRLGGLKSSFKMGPGAQVAWQHDGRVLPNGEVTFFDDGANPPVHHQSRAVRLALDLTTHRAQLRFAYLHPDPALLAASQGNMQTLPNGNVLVGYGAVPEITEFSRGGSVLLDAHLPYDLTFYRAFRHPWSGLPASPPSVLASMNDTGEETIVHASWNGATGVSAWRVLAGARQGALRPRATLPASGFESSTTLPASYSYAQVQALDATGHVLGTSPVAKTIGYYASLTL
jgi:hypothetical protein